MSILWLLSSSTALPCLGVQNPLQSQPCSVTLPTPHFASSKGDRSSCVPTVKCYGASSRPVLSVLASVLMLFRHACNISTSHGVFFSGRPVHRSVTASSSTLVASRQPILHGERGSRRNAEEVRNRIQQRTTCHDSTQSQCGTSLRSADRREGSGFCSFTTIRCGRSFTTTSTRHENQDLKTRRSTTHAGVASSNTTTNDQHATVTSTPVPPRSPTQSPSTAPSSSHSTLQTFLAHAARTGLSPSSTVYTGTVYEYLTASTLRAYGFDLHRVGGRGDRGVDLVGQWHVPLLSPTTGTWKEHTNPADDNVVVDTETFRVVVQCKRLVGKHAKIGPNLIRELDGTVRAARLAPLFESLFSNGPKGEDGNDGNSPTSSNTSFPTIGILVGTRPATKGVMESMRRSNRPLGWIMMEEEVMDCPTESSSSPPGAKVTVPNASFNNSTKEQAVSEMPVEGWTSKPSEGRTSDADADTDTDAEAEATRDSAPTLDVGTSETSTDDNILSDSDTHTTPQLPIRGRVRQILWNQAARNLGLDDVSVVPRYDSSGREEVVLMRGGRVWGGS